MRGFIVIILLLVAGAVALWALVPGVRTHDTQDMLAALAGEGKVESLAHEPSVIFVPSQQHFKIAFPGKPLQVNDNNAWLHQEVLRLPFYMVADKQISFYASERQLTQWDFDSSIERTPLAATSFDPSVAQRTNPTGNNELVKQSSAGNDVMNLQKFLDTQCDELGKSLGTIDEKYPVDLGGGMFSGRMASGTIATTGDKFRVAVYYDTQTKRLFTAAVVGTPARVDSAQAKQFFKSMYVWR